MTSGIKPCLFCGGEYFKRVCVDFWQCENCGCRTDSIENVAGADLNTRNLSTISTADLVKELESRKGIESRKFLGSCDIDIRCHPITGMEIPPKTTILGVMG